MKFTRKTYIKAHGFYDRCALDAWMAYVETDDDLDYQAFKLLTRKAHAVIDRYEREKGPWR